MPEVPPRRGLAPVPGRVPPLPSLPVDHAERHEQPQQDHGAHTRHVGDPATSPPPSAQRRTTSPREFKLHKEARDWVDTTAFSIRLRTRCFDGSALLRGVLDAIRTSGIDIERHCGSEEEVAAYLLQFLPPRDATPR